MYHWVIDPGHGDKAKRHSPQFTDDSVYHEYQFNYSVAEHLCSLLHSQEIPHHQTIKSPQGVSNSLSRRVVAANAYPSKHPKYLLSIHTNLAKPEWRWQQENSGVEAWYAHQSYHGKLHAQMFCDVICEEHGFVNRGVKSRANSPYYLISQTDMPALVLEIGFLNHSEEVSYLTDPGAQEAIAASIAKVILQINSQ